MAKKIGVLALQGAFREHCQSISRIGAEASEIRKADDLKNLDGIILPGGESTTMGKLLLEFGIFDPLKNLLQDGLPVFGTCAGLILLCKTIKGSEQPRLGVLNASIERNAFGRQFESFETALEIPDWGQKPYIAIFIRAPLLQTTGADVKVLASLEKNGITHPVAVRQQNILGVSFHPELSSDYRCHEYFLNMC